MHDPKQEMTPDPGAFVEKAEQAATAHARVPALTRRQIVEHVLVIALGAAIGANLRYGISLWAAARFGTAFPYGTLLINVLGSFAIGVLMLLFTTRVPVTDSLRLLVVTGLLGGFTTFSSFSYEAYVLATAGHWLRAGLYLFGSVALGMLGVTLGAGLVRLFN